MNLTTEVILTSTTYGTASGNYDGSSQEFYTDPGRAADYYAGQGSIQTVTLHVTGFQGRIKIEASLNDDPVAAVWFELYDYDHRLAPITDYYPVSFTGNYVWIRAKITDFDAGTIDSIAITY